MNEQFKRYEVEPEPLWTIFRGLGLDGADIIAQAKKRNWRAIPLWGKQGWSLGKWSYVIIFFKDREASFDVIEYVEHDVTMYSCPTAEIREAITNELALFHWKQFEHGPPDIEKYQSAERLPAEYKGSFTKERQDC